MLLFLKRFRIQYKLNYYLCGRGVGGGVCDNPQMKNRVHKSRCLITIITYDGRCPVVGVAVIIGFVIQISGYGGQTRYMNFGAKFVGHR